MIEVSDITVVSTDGRRGTADIVCWSQARSELVTVRVEHMLGDKVLHVVDNTRDLDNALAREIATDVDCIADVREAILYQRDLNRDRN